MYNVDIEREREMMRSGVEKIQSIMLYTYPHELFHTGKLHGEETIHNSIVEKRNLKQFWFTETRKFVSYFGWIVLSELESWVVLSIVYYSI